jgi:predicted ATP-dependent serine protease
MPDLIEAQLAATEPRLIGRDDELVKIDQLLARGKAGSASLVLIGDPGVGKSALLSVALARAGQAGVRVLLASGLQSESELTFAGLHQVLRPVPFSYTHQTLPTTPYV